MPQRWRFFGLSFGLSGVATRTPNQAMRPAAPLCMLRCRCAGSVRVLVDQTDAPDRSKDRRDGLDAREALLIVADGSRGKFGHFKLGAHLLDLRGLLLKAGSESFNLLLLLGYDRFLFCSCGL